MDINNQIKHLPKPLILSVCGVICSECPAYMGNSKGPLHQEQTVTAWHRIYGLSERPESIACGGCLGADEDIFYTSRECKARQCCRSKGYTSCAECPEDNCQDLEKAQAVWDEVPKLKESLSPEDFATYAEPYCRHRERLAAARTEFRRS